MNNEVLARNVRCLPLVNSWYAHPFLIYPLTFSLYVKHSHLPMLDSFIDDPAQHRIAVQMPELRGGPFIDHAGEVDDVRRFRDETVERCAAQLRCADALSELYRMLHTSAKGAGIAGLYGSIEEIIRFRTEISYDVSKQPMARFIEPLFYQAPLHDTSLQSCVLEEATDASRSFVLSTPQLARKADTLRINLPFGDPVWTHLHDGTRTKEELLERLRPHLEHPTKDLPLLQRFIAPAAPPVPEAPMPEDGVRIRYFGHACVLLQSAEVSILVDPLISYPGESPIDHFTLEDLPAHIDYVLITHPHQDHVVLETLLRLRHKIGRIVVGRAGGGNLQDVSLKRILQQCGFEDVVELGEYDDIVFNGGRIVGAPFYGEHADLDIRAKLVYGVEIKGISSIFFADSNPPAPEFYEPLRRLMPKVDCMFLGMECVGGPATWVYGPFLQKMLTRGEDQSRRLDGSNASTALGLQQYFQPGRLYVYAMGAEPWITHLTSILYSEELPQFKEARQLEQAVRARGRHAEVLFGKMECTY